MTSLPAVRPYPIATLCGTMRLHQDMLTVADELTRQGHIVLLPLPINDGSSLHGPTPATDDDLDALHRAKIDMADVVVVVTKQKNLLFETGSDAWHFGESTVAEWAYAERLGKAVKVVCIGQHQGRDTTIWIDEPCPGEPVVAQAPPGTATVKREAVRRSSRRTARRAVSAHTFRIG